MDAFDATRLHNAIVVELHKLDVLLVTEAAHIASFTHRIEEIRDGR